MVCNRAGHYIFVQWFLFQISTAFASWLRYCSDVAHRRPTKLCTMFGRLLCCYNKMYIFGGSFPLMEFCQVQNARYIQFLHSPILAVLLHGTQAAGVSQTLRHGTRNGITQIPQRVPPTFGRAAIILGIGAHSSYIGCNSLTVPAPRCVLDNCASICYASLLFRVSASQALYSLYGKYFITLSRWITPVVKCRCTDVRI